LEQAVVAGFFEAIRPAQLDILERVLAAKQREEQELLQIWEERLKRGQYAVQLAGRQYDAVDPDNRLVTAELERRWEKTLQEQNQLQKEYENFKARQVPAVIEAELAQQFRQMSEALPTLWQSGQLSNADKKELLRCLVRQVIVGWESKDTVVVRVVWVSGHYSLIRVEPPIHNLEDLTNYAEMSERINQMWADGLSEQAIAEQLTKEGFRTARRNYVSKMSVCKIRLKVNKTRSDYEALKAPSIGDCLAVREFALKYGFEQIWLYRQIEIKRISAEYISYHPRCRTYLLKEAPELVTQLQTYWQRKEAWKVKRQFQAKLIKEDKQ
jgi:hypothetical protein